MMMVICIKQHLSNICDTLPVLVPFVQFKTHENHQWRSVTFSKVARYLNCTNCTKSLKTSHLKLNS